MIHLSLKKAVQFELLRLFLLAFSESLQGICDQLTNSRSLFCASNSSESLDPSMKKWLHFIEKWFILRKIIATEKK